MTGLIFGLVLAQTPPDVKTNPGSLYGPNSSSIFLDRTARQVGDILMIVIDEQSAASFAATTEATKQDSSRVNAKTFLSFFDSLFKPLTNGVGASSSVSGDGSTTQAGRMRARMSAIVRQVMPGGNLLVEGSRTLITNKESQTFTLSGLVRPIDIAADNSIPSSLIAEAEIKMTGRGMIQERQRKGVLTQVLDWLF